MRILDRQRYWAFLKAYVICFTALVGLYIVIDAFSNYDEFLKRADGVREMFQVMGRFYLVHTSEFYDRLCGVITMMAAIFTVTWMQKNNELLAMLAAGISTQRVIRPVVISSIIVSGLAVANQELIMPRLAQELQKSHDDDGSRQVGVFTRRDENKIWFHGEKADRKAQVVTSVSVTIPPEIFGDIRELSAKQAQYIPPDATRYPLHGGWLLRGAHLSPEADNDALASSPLTRLPNSNGFPPVLGNVATLGHETYFLRTGLTFQAITRDRHWYQYATTIDLVQGLSDPANAPEKMEISVFLHNRILRPMHGLALLCLSLPLVLGGYGRNMFINLGLSLGTSAVFYGLAFMAKYLGENALLSPEQSAWYPLIGFGTIAVARWGAIRT
jgi:lipopolysaccharide export system permease protein